METEKLSLRNKLFSDAIDSADTGMAILISKMKHRGATEGKLTLSISLELEPEEIIDPQSGKPTQIDRVNVHYKAAYSVPDKDAITGDIINRTAAVISEDGRMPTLAEIGDDQTTMF